MVANVTSGFTTGIMGIGLGASFFKGLKSNNVTIHDRAPNIIDQMAAQSIISSRAFGMELGSSSTEGR